MIIQALQTLLLTLSMGISANTNVYNVEKKHRLNAEQNYSETYNYSVQQYYTETVDNREFVNAKYYLGNASNNTTIYYNIYSTTYRFSYKYQENWTTYRLISIYKITSYYNARNVAFTLDENATFVVPSGNTYQLSGNTINYETTQNLDPYIDMTITASTRQILETAIFTTYMPANKEQTNYNYGMQSNYTIDITNSYSPNQMLQNETRWVVMTTTVAQTGSPQINNNGYIVPGTTTVSGTALMPDYDYEVVDIPGLMFTVLTLPFSFISQAFNLTVFPGTPYQLNFSNLFMTIIAIFILLWLIKHIFK